VALDVHLSVVFNCDENEPVALLAKRYMELFKIEPVENNWPKYEYNQEYDKYYSKEVGWFLSDLSKRTGHNWGPKGGLSMWGTVGNFTNPDDFIGCLKEFWFDLLSSQDCGPANFEHVIIFYEQEQSEQAKCYEIYLNPKKRNKYTLEDLVVKQHDLPFCWNQY